MLKVISCCLDRGWNVGTPALRIDDRVVNADYCQPGRADDRQEQYRFLHKYLKIILRCRRFSENVSRTRSRRAWDRLRPPRPIKTADPDCGADCFFWSKLQSV